MKTKAPAILLLALPLLAGCGSVVGSFVPPQTIENPAGLDGAVMTTSDALRVQKVVGAIQYDTTNGGQSFGDIEYPKDVPFGIKPHQVSVQVAFKTAVLTGLCTMPDTFNVTMDSFAVSVWNAGDKPGAATLSGQPKVTAKATKKSGGVGTATYELSANTVAVTAGASVTDKAITILTSGGKNDASASAQISADNDGLAGCRLSFTLGDSKVILSDFK